MNNGDYDNDNKINENSSDFSEVNNDNKNVEDFQGGEEKGSQVDKEEGRTDEVQEESAQKEGERDKAQGENREAEGQKPEEVGEQRNVNEKQSYEASYAPPSYVPDFTIVGQTENSAYDYNRSGQGGTDKDKKESRFSNTTIVVLCVVTLVIAVILGTLIGMIMGNGITFDFSGNAENELVNIIRSDREITVEELPGNTGYTDLSVAQVAALVGESVVEITTTQVQTGIGGQYIQSGAGSGVVFDQKGTTGYIVTNYHVIEGADDITVRVKKDGSHVDYKAAYMAGDDGEDIAVIKITTASDHTLTCAVFADSEKLVVGQEVVAIGNPLGQLGGTVTDGIISALDREIMVGDYSMTLLQTNAAINPGNSGGGLFNMSGELVGIVNAKQSSTGIEGLGFAIPADVVAKDIEDVLEVGYIRGRNTLGITVQYGKWNNYSAVGVYVTDAGSTGFQKGDRITKIGDKTISSLADYNAALKSLTVGNTVSVVVARSGRFTEVDVTVNTRVDEDTSKY